MESVWCFAIYCLSRIYISLIEAWVSVGASHFLICLTLMATIVVHSVPLITKLMVPEMFHTVQIIALIYPAEYFTDFTRFKALMLRPHASKEWLHIERLVSSRPRSNQHKKTSIIPPRYDCSFNSTSLLSQYWPLESVSVLFLHSSHIHITLWVFENLQRVQ